MFWHPNDYCARSRFRVDYSFDYQATDLYAIRRENNKILVPKVDWVEPPEDPVRSIEPLLRLHDREGESQIQALFDALWAHGLRPRQDVQPDALVAAKNEHIQDLRNIIGKLFDKQ